MERHILSHKAALPVVKKDEAPLEIKEEVVEEAKPKRRAPKDKNNEELNIQ